MTEKQSAKLDFKGLDDNSKSDFYLRNSNAFEDATREFYIKRLTTFNKDSLLQNAEPFRFLKKENCSIIIFILPVEFNHINACMGFFISTPGERTENVHIVTAEELSDLDSYTTAHRFFVQKMLPLYNFHESQIIMQYSEQYDTLSQYENNILSNKFDIKNYIFLRMSEKRVIEIIKDEIYNFKRVNETPLSYFAKDVYKFPFSLFDLQPLVKLVKDEEFTYQLDQAMAAYHENLFLPCAATLGVVLETLCIKVLEKHNTKKPKSGDTQLGKLIERLSSERIITRKDNARLDVAYRMRNLAAHTNPGSTLKEDCHFMLNVINTIAFEYLKTD